MRGCRQLALFQQEAAPTIHMAKGASAHEVARKGSASQGLAEAEEVLNDAAIFAF